MCRFRTWSRMFCSEMGCRVVKLKNKWIWPYSLGETESIRSVLGACRRMARSGDLGWAGSRIWARVWRRPKKVNLRGNGPDGRWRKILLWKAAGGLGRPFGGSGLSKYPFGKYNPCKNTEHQNFRPDLVNDFWFFRISRNLNFQMLGCCWSFNI